MSNANREPIRFPFSFTAARRLDLWLVSNFKTTIYEFFSLYPELRKNPD